MKHTSSAVDTRELGRAHLEQVLKSKTFQRSAKLAKLLTRLAEPTLNGTNDPVKEQILGIEVFSGLATGILRPIASCASM